MRRPRSHSYPVRLSLPLSIVLASVVLALGLYLGLRPPPAGVAPPATAPTDADADTPPPLAPAEHDTLAHVTAVVVDAHPRWKAACWDTADPATRQAGHYVAALAFDATGTLTVSGIGEERGRSDPNVAQCLRQQVNTFRIPAPGRPVAFDVPFVLP